MMRFIFLVLLVALTSLHISWLDGAAPRVSIWALYPIYAAMVIPVLFFYRNKNIGVAQLIILILSGMFFSYFAYVVAEIISGNAARVSSLQIGTQTIVSIFGFFGWLQLPLFKYLLDRIRASAVPTTSVIPRQGNKMCETL